VSHTCHSFFSSFIQLLVLCLATWIEKQKIASLPSPHPLIRIKISSNSNKNLREFKQIIISRGRARFFNLRARVYNLRRVNWKKKKKIRGKFQLFILFFLFGKSIGLGGHAPWPMAGSAPNCKKALMESTWTNKYLGSSNFIWSGEPYKYSLIITCPNSGREFKGVYVTQIPIHYNKILRTTIYCFNYFNHL
jgi:hypothetical protein